MKSIARKLLGLSFAAVFAAAPMLSSAEPAPKPVADYSVFVDAPTGFVFVKLPAGWKFAGKVEAQEVARLPSSVLTDLVDRGDTSQDEVYAKS